MDKRTKLNKKESVAYLYTKQEVIDYIWQYSKFYGNKLGDCERYYYDGDGYVALILMFEVTENICKSVAGDYESSFYKVVEKLHKEHYITDYEREFLSLKQCSIRNIRNLFAHANLMAINIVQEEKGRDVYYPLSENESCLLLYKLISALVFNVLLDVVKSNLLLSIPDELEGLLLKYNIKIVELTAEETLKLQGFAEKDILKMNVLVDENAMIRLADNGSNVDVLAEIFKGLA